MPSFELRELAIHVVLRQMKGHTVEPKLSQGLSPLDGASAQFLERKFHDALAEASDIVRMDDPDSLVPDVVHGYHLGLHGLLETSQLIARRLQQVQTGVTSDGLVLVGDVRRDAEKLLVIAKMEHERGARAEPVENAAGESVYQIELLDDLFLTSKTKVFKVASFDERCSKMEDFRGKLTDAQTTGRHVADYFLYEFLGCERARRAEVLTQSFFRAATKALRSMPVQERALIHVAMVTDLLSNARQVRVKDFAHNHVPRDMREDFIAAVTTAELPLAFTKDTTLIESELRSVQINYENGSILYSLPESIGESVIISDERTSVNSRPSALKPGTKRLSQAERFPEVEHPTIGN